LTISRCTIVCSDEPFDVLYKCIRRVHEGQVWVNSQEIQWILESLATREPVQAVNALGIPLLTNREDQIVQLVTEGLTILEIAAKIGVSATTVKADLFRIYKKLEVSGRTELIVYTLSRRQSTASA
jgi:DNA-binding NarL/FixJ family response regulator